MPDYSFLVNNGPLVVIIAIIMITIGKYLFASKSDITGFNTDINNVSQKVDGGFHNLDMKIVTTNNTASKDILDTVYQKFLTKEMADKNEQIHKEFDQRQAERMEKLECNLEYIRQKVDKNETDNQVHAEKLENILDILKELKDSH